MEKQIFHLEPEHLKLLQRFCVGWQDAEFGAPEIDPKRPYGNSDVYQDMLEILGLKELKPGIFEFTLGGVSWLLKGEDKNNIYLDGADEAPLISSLKSLHQETEKALQVCLSAQKFEVGQYEAEPYTDEWVKAR